MDFAVHTLHAGMLTFMLWMEKFRNFPMTLQLVTF